MRYQEPTLEQLAAYVEWSASLPKAARDLADQFEPWSLYRLKSTGHRVFPYSYGNDGTLTVVVSGRFNLVDFERRVFSVQPSDLTPCELPAPDEPVGAALTDPADIEKYLRTRASELPKHDCGSACSVCKIQHEQLGKDRAATTPTGTTGATRERRDRKARRG